MATSQLTINVLNLDPFKEFIIRVYEIAGTTNDPDTAANLRAAVAKLHDGTTHK